MVTVRLAELALLFGSPLYVASTEAVPFAVPVRVIEQAPLARVQVFELNATDPAPDCDHVTVPVGE